MNRTKSWLFEIAQKYIILTLPSFLFLPSDHLFLRNPPLCGITLPKSGRWISTDCRRRYSSSVNNCWIWRVKTEIPKTSILITFLFYANGVFLSVSPHVKTIQHISNYSLYLLNLFIELPTIWIWIFLDHPWKTLLPVSSRTARTSRFECRFQWRLMKNQMDQQEAQAAALVKMI